MIIVNFKEKHRADVQNEQLREDLSDQHHEKIFVIPKINIKIEY